MVEGNTPAENLLKHSELKLTDPPEPQIGDFWVSPTEFGDSDVDDIVTLVALWWWLISDVGGRIIILATFFYM